MWLIRSVNNLSAVEYLHPPSIFADTSFDTRDSSSLGIAVHQVMDAGIRVERCSLSNTATPCAECGWPGAGRPLGWPGVVRFAALDNGSASARPDCLQLWAQRGARKPRPPRRCQPADNDAVTAT